MGSTRKSIRQPPTFGNRQHLCETRHNQCSLKKCGSCIQVALKIMIILSSCMSTTGFRVLGTSSTTTTTLLYSKVSKDTHCNEVTSCREVWPKAIATIFEFSRGTSSWSESSLECSTVFRSLFETRGKRALASQLCRVRARASTGSRSSPSKTLSKP